MKAATVAFVSAPTGSCSLSPDLNNLVTDANNFVNKGGVLTLAFGGNLSNQGANRQHIQEACTDVPTLQALIQSAMDQFQTRNIEFDIEDNTLLFDTAAATRLAQALAGIKKANPTTHITYTLSTRATEIGPQDLAQVQAAQDAGVPIDTMMVMTMDMGVTDNVAASQTAVNGAAAQLAQVQGISTADALKKMGMLPAIGADDQGVVIDLAGATTRKSMFLLSETDHRLMTLSVSNFAKTQGLALVSYWSFNRDFPGAVGASSQSLSESGSPDQTSASQFFKTFQSAL
jgi:chitinase